MKLILFFVFIPLYHSYKLITSSQWKIIQQYKSDRKLTDSMRDKVDYILFRRHIPLVYGMANSFTRVHRYKTKNIKDDIILYGYKGLYDSVKNYDGKRLFNNYARIHIKGSMYKCMTDNYIISKISKSERRKNIFKRKTHIVEERSYLSGRDYLSHVSDIDNIEYIRYWNKINMFDPFIRRIFYYKFDYMFNKVRSNKQIAELMVCSEEYIRKIIKNNINILLDNDL